MLTIDWIALIMIAASVILGAFLGFGKTLKMFTSGVIGIIISVILTYFFIGVVSSWGFVQTLLGDFTAVLTANGSKFCNFLLKIGIEKIVLAVSLFIVIQFLRIIIVCIIKNIVEINAPVMKTINRLLGIILFAAILLIIALLIMHVIQLIGGNTAKNFASWIDGSALKADWLYEHNPLKYIVERAYVNT